MRGVAEGDTPLLLVATELDPPEFQEETLSLAAACLKARGALPRLIILHGHNHFSSTLHLSGAPSLLGAAIADFCHTLD